MFLYTQETIFSGEGIYKMCYRSSLKTGVTPFPWSTRQREIVEHTERVDQCKKIQLDRLHTDRMHQCKGRPFFRGRKTFFPKDKSSMKNLPENVLFRENGMNRTKLSQPLTRT